jgi:hypothetical protein
LNEQISSIKAFSKQHQAAIKTLINLRNSGYTEKEVNDLRGFINTSGGDPKGWQWGNGNSKIVDNNLIEN